MTSRLHDWPARLSAVFRASQNRPFLSGAHDCGLFVGDCIEALTGVDPAADWRGKYSSDREGIALTRSRSLPGIMRRIGLRSIPVAQAERGDIGLAPVGESTSGTVVPMLVVFDGAWLRGPCGSMAPRSAARRAWRVG